MGQRERFARGALDRLETVAPVLGVRDYSVGKDGAQLVSPADGNRIAGMTRVVEAAGVRIGLIHNLGKGPGPEIPAAPGGLPEIDGAALTTTLAQKFGGPVDVVAYAGTHRAATLSAGGVLFVNPGSPTYPKGPGRVPGVRTHGTVGVLELSDGAIAYECIDLHCLATG
jgi:predicted phosphodiesterase